MRIVITGGHHNSALAVIDTLNQQGKHTYLWFGHQHSVWGDKNVSAEYREVTMRGIPFIDLKAGKLYKTYHPRKLIRLPRGFLNAFYHLIQFKPDLVLTFGGYLSPPTALAAWFLHIPIFVHEQTVVAGWSNRFVARFARKVFVTWEESAKFFPQNKVVVTGLPLRKEIRAAKRIGKQGAGSKKAQTMYITGGKQGSLTINKVVKKALPQLLREFSIIHQCGSVSFLNSKKELEKAVSTLSSQQQKKYQVRDYFFGKDLTSVLQQADFVVCRGGAHTIYEMAYLEKPCIIVPIPWVSHQEQLKNAQVLQRAGTSLILEERNFNSQALLKACYEMRDNFRNYKKKALVLSEVIKKDAASKIAQEISKIKN